jgi:hypothetical protein
MRERSSRKLFAAVAAVAVVFGLIGASSAMADSITTIGSTTDIRQDLPARSGTLVRADYGPFTIPAASGSTLGQIHNAIDSSAPAPCTNCYITDIIPNLVYTPGGATANLDTGVGMHHFVLSNAGSGKQDATCPGTGPGILGERFMASGNERTHMHMPNGFGYQQGSNSTYNMIYHLINRNTTTKSVYVEVIYRYVTSADPVRPLWLDIDGMGAACNDSEYTIPTGYSDSHASWTSTVNGRIVAISGHMHDVDITGPAACTSHCPAEGKGIAVSAELVGGPATDYYGPNPPNNPPPADLTGATICRSEGYFGTSWAGSPTGGNNQWLGHLDTASLCGIQTGVPAGAEAEAYPAGGAYPPADGYAIKSGNVIKLHAEYQNDTGSPQTDAMGIMVAYESPTEAGYVRPKGASPMYVSLVPAFTPCTSANRVHAPPLNFGSCNPPAQSSGQLTIGSPDANGATANFVGFAKFKVVNGNVATAADEADVQISTSLLDVRKKSDLSDYTGQLQLRPTLQVVDRNNGPAEVGSGQAVDLPVTVPCSATADTTIGSTCSISTTADAVLGSTLGVRENRRSVWQMQQVKVYDGGADGVASTTGDNAVFAVQGVFAP